MEGDMEIEVFEAYEIDIDYEFDAARYFDFTRPELLAEARGAEIWFESAQSYPPSPFVSTMVLRENILKENVNTSPESNIVKNTTLHNNDLDVGTCPESLAFDIDIGLEYHLTRNNCNGKSIPDVKIIIPRSSTLMKPTASLLAKQNRLDQAGALRFQMPFGQNNKKGSCNSSGIENQAAKRQKLDGGLLCKLADMKQQTQLVHKVPRKDRPLDGNLTRARLKLTNPREPDLETAQRAQRASTEVRSHARRFKARPLNQKILEAPSLSLSKKSTPRLPNFQVFHLKTSERAMQHRAASSPSSSSLHLNDSVKGLGRDKTRTVAESFSRRPSTTGAPKQDERESMQNFKTRHLNKKILSSKGDKGIFRNIKREATVPMDFNFHSQKRTQHNPPVDLFSKLSLTSGLPPNKESQLKLPQTFSTKGPKENRFQSFYQEHKMTHLVKEKCSVIRGKQILCEG